MPWEARSARLARLTPGERLAQGGVDLLDGSPVSRRLVSRWKLRWHFASVVRFRRRACRARDRDRPMPSGRPAPARWQPRPARRVGVRPVPTARQPRASATRLPLRGRLRLASLVSALPHRDGQSRFLQRDVDVLVGSPVSRRLALRWNDRMAALVIGPPERHPACRSPASDRVAPAGRRGSGRQRILASPEDWDCVDAAGRAVPGWGWPGGAADGLAGCSAATIP